MSPEFSRQLQSKYAGPLSADERRLLQGMREAIDFVLANNLNVRLVQAVVGHDLVEMAHRGSLAMATEKGFLPKSLEFIN